LGSLIAILGTEKAAELTVNASPVQVLGFIHFVFFIVALMFFAVFSLGNNIAAYRAKPYIGRGRDIHLPTAVPGRRDIQYTRFDVIAALFPIPGSP